MLSWMKHRAALRAGLVGAMALTLTAGAAWADQWNDRTILKFSEPIMVPGATLEPGTYVFRLTDTSGSRHIVEISREGTSETLALVLAVPMKRDESKGDVVVKFNPTEAGSPPAMKGWFYPGSIYGHEFVYSGEQARKIAERTKTIVLSRDIEDSDFEKGTLRTYDASGVTRNWVPDQAAAASWESWQKNRRATATAITETPPADKDRPAQSTAPMMKSDFKAQRVSLDDLEDNAAQYIGKSVSVDAEVDEVFGPRLFKIDERNWADFEGELLVYVPTHLAAVVREGDQVTVTGEVKRFVKADFENEWGWLNLDQATEVELGKRPVLVATHVVGGTDQTVLVVNLEERAKQARTDRPAGATGTAGAPGRSETPAGTSGAMARTVTDLAMLGPGGDDLIGRRVNLDRVRIDLTGQQHGLFAKAGDHTIFILPAVGERPAVSKGESVKIEGIVLEMPRFMKERLRSETGVTNLNDDIYVYALGVNK